MREGKYFAHILALKVEDLSARETVVYKLYMRYVNNNKVSHICVTPGSNS